MSLPERKPIRLRGYSYSSAGTYFITIHVHDAVLSEIIDRGDECPDVRLTPTGEIVEKYILSMQRSKGVTVENYVIMPDHIHLLIGVDNPAGEMAKGKDPANEKIPRIIAGFKRLSQKETGRKIFQDRYNDHIVRNERDYEMIWQYIEDNPANWLAKKKWQAQKRKLNM